MIGSILEKGVEYVNTIFTRLVICPNYAVWFILNRNTIHSKGIINSLMPRLNRRPFADDIFKCIFLNENEWILPRISLKFLPKVRINNIPALVQIMAWRRPGDKSLSEPMMVSLLTHVCVTRPQWVKCHIHFILIILGKQSLVWYMQITFVFQWWQQIIQWCAHLCVCNKPILVRSKINDDDVNKWKHCPRYWPFVRGIHRSSVNSHHKGQWRGALMFSLICSWTKDWANNREAGDLRRHRAHYDVIVMTLWLIRC